MIKRIEILILTLCLILVGCSENSEKKDASQEKEFKNGNVILYGIPNKMALLNSDFKANQANKHMWHIWTDLKPEEIKKFRVEAVNLSTNVKSFVLGKTKEDNSVELVSEYIGSSGGPNNGADIHIPSIMMFPEAGKWRLEVYLNNTFFDSMSVNVK
ncbi:DUF4871 domain-containing protein [Paenibacillus sp. MMS18-CY102]|uniref:DUF4871 domain-containing protein n=1 Tax=Paenibacillus sp. MMS18-CY102 TaxID=2682849 RepID=UPI00136549D0|nr:DUF4871 domain-containing protein [Paenibacillus sp. MMS18-CY102]MWC26698.1 DUF4871 domain-containing protein [Paenibacillus sp. MMS18-CY102]